MEEANPGSHNGENDLHTGDNDGMDGINMEENISWENLRLLF